MYRPNVSTLTELQSTNGVQNSADFMHVTDIHDSNTKTRIS